MRVQDITNTNQLDWSFGSHCFGSCAIGAKEIVEGKIVKFDVFQRGAVSTLLSYVNTFYFGLVEIDGTPALRVNNSTNLDANGSHSLIPSWYKEANDPIYISARLTLFLMREGSDWFINNKI